jgi:hypothetical protein
VPSLFGSSEAKYRQNRDTDSEQIDKNVGHLLSMLTPELKACEKLANGEKLHRRAHAAPLAF